MERNVLKDIERWYAKPRFKPLLLNGARQVGKTWLMLELARKHCGDNYIYVNFEEDARLRDLFVSDFDMDRIKSLLSIAKEKEINDDTLFLFDELQAAPRGVMSLKYFCENSPARHVIAAGSLLGISVHPGDSFPVGKVEMLDVYPMSFDEFLLATGNGLKARAIASRQWEALSLSGGQLERLLKEYYYVGGMPGVVSAYVNGATMAEVREIQLDLLRDYELDFSKHAPATDVPKIRLVWQSVPSQLAKENRKFVYGQVRKGARARDFETAIRWLQDAGLIYLVHRITRGEVPLKAYEELDVFKIYMMDVGLLGAMSGLTPETLIEGTEMFSIFKGALTEQYVCQQLTTDKRQLYYWSSNDSQAEVDFVTEMAARVMPIEVKATVNLQSKSLRAFRERFSLDQSLRFSLAGHKEQQSLTNIPLWAISAI